ncbi:MAG: HAMP domain-containing histidine kinase [Elusimicrobia bacterium]|nr:HAMP domain-containing histidine kinase [Elusimicrobiota bacterium]
MLGFAAGVATGALLAAGAGYWLYRRHSRALGRFFAFAAHEINNPITAVNMTILNLLSGVFGEVDPGQLQWLEMMREQLLRLTGMVGELRDFIHRQMQDDLMIHLEGMTVKDLVEGGLRAVRNGCLHAGVGLESSVPDGLPDVLADPDRLPRTLNSLLFHARKFRSEGPLLVSAGPLDDGRSVEIVVEFQGPLLSAEQARQSLDVFFPARQRSDQSLIATGLGLGVLKHLMRLQGGDLEHEADGKGRSRLRLTVPARRAGP